MWSLIEEWWVCQGQSEMLVVDCSRATTLRFLFEFICRFWVSSKRQNKFRFSIFPLAEGIMIARRALALRWMLIFTKGRLCSVLQNVSPIILVFLLKSRVIGYTTHLRFLLLPEQTSSLQCSLVGLQFSGLGNTTQRYCDVLSLSLLAVQLFISWKWNVPLFAQNIYSLRITRSKAAANSLMRLRWRGIIKGIFQAEWFIHSIWTHLHYEQLVYLAFNISSVLILTIWQSLFIFTTVV